MAPNEVACIRVVLDAQVADALLEHPDGLSVNEISAKTGVDKGKLSRILRRLATSNCFYEGV